MDHKQDQEFLIIFSQFFTHFNFWFFVCYWASFIFTMSVVPDTMSGVHYTNSNVKRTLQKDGFSLQVTEIRLKKAGLSP